MELDNETFIIIPERIQRVTEIDWPHRAIWGIVYAFSCNGGECWLSVDQIAERIHRKRRQTSSMIQKLIDLNLIEIASFNGRKRSLRITEKSSFSNVQFSAHVQNPAQQTREISHISNAEIRTTDARNSAHLENKKEEKEKKTKSVRKNNSGQRPNTIDECREYFLELGSDDYESFWNYWSSMGWKRRAGKIVCWKATARNWVLKNKKSHEQSVDKHKPFDANSVIEWATK